MLPVLALAFQLQLLPPAPRAVDDDSLHDVGRAHDAQAGFERGRRYLLPWSLGDAGRCDVHVGRYCWWSEAGDASPPPAEPEEIAHRRLELLSELDTLGTRHPGDAWIAGMRVYYRLESSRVAAADTVARACRATAWWCTALQASVARARDDVAAADSEFGVALAAMPDSTRCAWRDISALLPADVRDRYSHQSCAERTALESRYWMLATPRLSSAGNEWRAAFYARRVAATLLASALTPHRIPWGSDAEELILRYGLPIAWSRVAAPTGLDPAEPEILGHDPSPSFDFGPRAALLDVNAASGDDGWSLEDVHGESRYAHRAIRRIAGMSAQLARFRRGDSTLLAAAWATSDDSLAMPMVSIGGVGLDGRPQAQRQDSRRAGRGSVMLEGATVLVGVDLADSATGTLARTRTLFAPRHDSGSVALSDILLYRPGEQEAPTLPQALTFAVPGDTLSVARPIGLYWEAYGVDAPSADSTAAPETETSIFVERIDHGFFRSARQHLGLADPDSPVRVRWSESRPPNDGIASHALSLDLSTLPAGRYRITVGVAGAAGSASASREVELREP